MTLSTLLSALSKRGASEATLRAGSVMQICVDGVWRAQSVNSTDEMLDLLVSDALLPGDKSAWNARNGSANFTTQGFSVSAQKTDGVVQIGFKRVIEKSGKPLSAQDAAQIRASPWVNVNTFEPPAPPPVAPPPPAPVAPVFTPPPPVVPAVAPTPPPLPNSSGDEWFYGLNDEEYGPVASTQMRHLINMTTLSAQTLVWKPGMSQWLPISQTVLAQFLPHNTSQSSARQLAWRSREQNDSGTGASAVLPSGLGGFNWGAMLLPVLWCIVHNQWAWAIVMFIVGFIPVVGQLTGIILAIYLGFNGNLWAWQHRAWNDEQDFKDCQTIWRRWGIAVFLFMIVAGILIAIEEINSKNIVF